MKRKIGIILALVAASVVLGQLVKLAAQTSQSASSPSTKIFTAYSLVPISATAAAGAPATLTIPAPTNAAFSNYLCYLAIEGSNNNTAAVVTNAVTTSTNFNSFAGKFSVPSAASNDTGVLVLLNEAAPGCAKSAVAGVATTFTSPTSASEAYAWYAVYFQAP